MIDGNVVINVDERMEETDVINMLNFQECDLENLLMTHAASQAYWEALAIRMENRLADFESWGKKWWAHNKKFAKDALNSEGEKKPTEASLKDQVILMYSNDITHDDRNCILVKAHGHRYSNKSASVIDIGDYVELGNKFISMNPSWYYETITVSFNKMKSDTDSIKSIAKRLDSRAFHMEHLIDLIKPKRHNMGPMSISEGERMGKFGKGM